MQENITMVNTLSVASANASGHASAATTPTTSGNFTTTANAVNPKVPRRPRKLPEIPRKHQGTCENEESDQWSSMFRISWLR